MSQRVFLRTLPTDDIPGIYRYQLTERDTLEALTKLDSCFRRNDTDGRDAHAPRSAQRVLLEFLSTFGQAALEEALAKTIASEPQSSPLSCPLDLCKYSRPAIVRR